MPIKDISALAALRTRMQWHQERQHVLAENIANSDTPNFRPHDLVEPRFDAHGGNASSGVPLAMIRTTSGQSIAGFGASSHFGQNGNGGFQTRPAGNAVSLEDQMLQVSANQMDYAAATSLYSRSLRLLKMAVDKA